MGFTTKDPKLQNQINVVASDIGRGQFNGRQIPKMRLWVLGDRTAVICTPTADGTQVERQSYRIDTGTHLAKEKLMIVNLYADEDTVLPLRLDSKGCGCGFGVVSNAPPIDEPHFLATVRADDEWWSEQP